MNKKHLAVINIVALSQGLIDKNNTPYIYSLLENYQIKPLKGVFPAVTTTAQSAMLTGKLATDHGIVGNGWYFKDLAEVGFWKQSNKLVQQPKIWESLKEKNAEFSCANSFWWYNMYSNVDYSATPRPHYLADGGKVFDLYSFPQGLHQSIEKKIGKFPFFNFWGPMANIDSSQWIANSALEIQEKYMPNLHLIYLPHLDYSLQKFGPKDPKIKAELQAIDKVVKHLCLNLMKLNTEFVLVSEYGIRPVEKPFHINRFLRKNNFIKVRNTLDFELLDCGASDAFAVADHQIAHIYVNDKSKIPKLKSLLSACDEIEQVIDDLGKISFGVAHERAGDLIVIAKKEVWFTYYYWLEDDKAPDFARTIDIHRKPGYDPVEMFFDANISWLKVKLVTKLLKKKLGFRTLMDVIGFDAELIKGSHGRLEDNDHYSPIVISRLPDVEQCQQLTDIYSLMEKYFIKDD